MYLRLTFYSQSDIDSLFELHRRDKHRPPLPEIIRQAVVTWLEMIRHPNKEQPLDMLLMKAERLLTGPVRSVDIIKSPDIRSGILSVRMEGSVITELQEICRRESIRLDEAISNAIDLYTMRVENEREQNRQRRKSS